MTFNVGIRTAPRGRRAIRGRGRKSNERPPKSVADLDAEMEVGCHCAAVRAATHCL